MDDALFTGYLEHCVDNHTIQQAWAISQALFEEYILEGVPIPPLFRIVPEAVALWNSCKGPIDNYSRMLKNSKNLTAKLTPIGNMWIHMIHTSVYNAFQAHHLIQNINFLLDDDKCLTWDDFIRHRHNNNKRDGNTMRSFILLLEQAIEAKIVAYYKAHPNKKRERDGDDDGIENIWGKKKRRIKRTEFFVGKRRKLRMDGVDHDQVNYPKQKHCFWCCCVTTGKDHYRLGFKTYIGCQKCEVPLCVTVREGETSSCYKQFHDATELNSPCSGHRTLHETAPKETGEQTVEDDDSSVPEGDKKPPYRIESRKEDTNDNDDSDESSVADGDNKPRYVFRRNALRTGANPNLK